MKFILIENHSINLYHVISIKTILLKDGRVEMTFWIMGNVKLMFFIDQKEYQRICKKLQSFGFEIPQLLN